MSSSTIATRRFGSPAGRRPPSPVSFAQAVAAVAAEVDVDRTSRPRPAGRARPAAPLTPSPVSAAGPRRSGWPSSSSTRTALGGARLGARARAGARTPRGSASVLRRRRRRAPGGSVSWAVRPMTSAASRGSCTPGQLDDDPPLAGAGEGRLGHAEGVDPAAQHLQRAVGRLGVGLDGRGVLGLEDDLGAAAQVEPELAGRSGSTRGRGDHHREREQRQQLGVLGACAGGPALGGRRGGRLT